MADRKLSDGLKWFIPHREEWIAGGVILLLVGFFECLLTVKFYRLFAAYSEMNWDIFMRNFHMSGFDPYLYKMVSDFDMFYDFFRHPLLAILLCPLACLNQLLGLLTGINCVQFVVGALMLCCTFFSSVFLYRMLHEQVGLGRWLSGLLVLFFFGFAYILLASFLPDHFGLSMCCLLLTMCVTGEKMKHKDTFSLKEAFWLVTVVAGITLSNGILVLLAVWMTNGRQFLSVRNVLMTAVMPFVLLTGIGAATDYFMTVGTYPLENPVETQLESTDVGAGRAEIVVENFFGESIQLHRKHILGDVLVKRPVIVAYSWKVQYVVEAVIVLLFLAGIWYGRKARLMWLAMACFAFSVLLHIIVAFGINEVYIMTAHWAYVIPLAIGFLLLRANRICSGTAVFLLTGITIYLWIYHGVLLFNYLTWPLKM